MSLPFPFGPQRRKRFRLGACLSLCLLMLSTALVGCDSDDDVTVIKLGHGLDASHPVHVAMEFMGERLAEKSGGAMRLDLYPSQQLGTERETLELLQIGSLGMTKVSSSVLENFAPTFQVLSLPFLFRDDAHRFAVLDGAENNPPSFYLSRHTESPAPDATAPPVLDA